LSIAKAVSKYILNSLSHNDRIGLIALSTDAQYPNSDSCLARQMANANYETKYHFSRFIDALQRTHDSTNHVLGLQRAFEMIANTFKEKNGMILFHSDIFNTNLLYFQSFQSRIKILRKR